MKTVIYVGLLLTFLACKGGGSPNKTKQQTSACACEKTMEKDSIIFVTNVRLTEEGKERSLLFNCADIQMGVASISDENGQNEREKFIFDVGGVSAVDQRFDLSEDFKYFTEEMQTQEDFFNTIWENKKLFFEFTVEAKKIKSIWKLNMED